MTDLARDLEATPKATPATPTIAPPTPAPQAPVPMPIGTLMVGHAEDRAESDADRMADSALGRLQRLSADGEIHVHGPGCERVRRSAAPSPAGMPLVGREGGVLDTGTSSAIDSARGSGAPLQGDVRRRMETAFATDFSSVRVHDDERSAKLNTAVSAHAFTTGNDIFFGRGKFAPSTPSGERMLAHELAHVVQNSGDGRRTVDARAAAAISRHVDRSKKIAREFTLPWRKTPEQKAAAKEKEDAAKAKKEQDKVRKDGGATLAELNEKVKKHGQKQQSQREDTGATLGQMVKDGREKQAKFEKDQVTYSGPAGGGVSLAEEVGKPSGAGTVVGAVGAGTHFGGAANGANASLGGLLLGDTAMGIRKGVKMREDGQEYDDKAMVELGNRKLKNQGSGFGAAAVSTASAGVGIAASKAGVASSMTQAGWTTAGKAGTAAGGAALATGGAAVGIVGGSAQVLQGMWRGGKAVMKLCRLAWGRASKMLSGRGPDWKQAIMGAEKYKAAIAALKVGLGALGIAAGALFLVSNPIGWGIGIAAAVAGGVWAAVKIAAKIKDANDRRKAANDIAQGKKPAEAFDEVTGGARDESSSSAGKPMTNAKSKTPRKPDSDKAGTGHVQEKVGPKSGKADARSKAIEQADLVARMASSHARLAHELRSALRFGNKNLVAGALERAAQDKAFSLESSVEREEDRELHDSMLLLSSVNVDPDEALAESGQELIEKKLSKLEAM